METGRTLGLFQRNAARRGAREPATARWVIVVLALFLVAGVVFAARTPVKALVRAEGTVVPDGRLLQIEHLTGGIVREVRAREGAAIARGEVLAVLSDPALSAEIRQTGQALRNTRQRIAALAAVLNEIDTDPSAQLVRASLVGTRGDVATAHAAARLAVFRARRAVLDDRIAQMDITIAALRTAAEVAAARVAAQAEQVRRLETLRARGHVAEFRVLDARDRLGELRGERAAAAVQLARAMAEQRAARADLAMEALSLREDVLNETRQMRDEEAHLVQVLADLRTRQAGLVLRAPEAGIVQSIAFPGIGEVMAPDAEMFEILPSDARLVAEIRLKTADIGHVATGDRVELKVQTYDFRRFGGVGGVIESISPNRITDPNGSDYFRATVALDHAQIGAGADRRPLRPGMDVAAEIQTQSRTVLQYLLKPIDRSLRAALTER